MKYNIRTCPFCREKPIIHQRKGYLTDDDKLWWQIFCMNVYCDIRPATEMPAKTKEEAIESWNNRHKR